VSAIAEWPRPQLHRLAHAGPHDGLWVQRRSTPAPRPTATGAGGDARKRDANLLLWAAAQPYPAATSRTGRAFVDELDPSSLQRGHNPRQTFDYPADSAVARFHSLNRRERYPRRLRQRFLLHARKYPRRFHLGCCEQCSSPTQIDATSGRSGLPDGSRIIADLQIMSQASRLQSPSFGNVQGVGRTGVVASRAVGKASIGIDYRPAAE
jgi:hypothetical protein